MKRILVVDDDRQFLEMVTVMLEEIGYQVGAVGSGDAALLKLAEEGPWDVVLCDILMPERDGIETIMAIRKMNKLQKVIAMSGGGRFLFPRQALEYAKDMGAREVLYKPFSMGELLKVLNTIME